MSDSETFFYVYTVYFHTHHHLPTFIDIVTGVQIFFYWGTDDLSVWLEVMICLFQFSLKAPTGVWTWGLTLTSLD